MSVRESLKVVNLSIAVCGEFHEVLYIMREEITRAAHDGARIKTWPQ